MQTYTEVEVDTQTVQMTNKSSFGPYAYHPSEIPGKAKLQPVFGARTQELHCFKTSVIQQLQLDAQLWAINFKDQAGAARRMV